MAIQGIPASVYEFLSTAGTQEAFFPINPVVTGQPYLRHVEDAFLSTRETHQHIEGAVGGAVVDRQRVGLAVTGPTGARQHLAGRPERVPHLASPRQFDIRQRPVDRDIPVVMLPNAPQDERNHRHSDSDHQAQLRRPRYGLRLEDADFVALLGNGVLTRMRITQEWHLINQ